MAGSPYVTVAELEPQQKEVWLVTNEDDIKDHLFSSNSDFRRLVEEHRSYDVKLREINEHFPVTDTEQLEEVKIKKRKLYLKDQMSRMIQQYRHGQEAHQ